MATVTFDVFRPAQTARTPVRIVGDLHVVFGEIQTDDGDYVTGGIAIPAALVGLDSIDFVIAGKPSVATHDVRWNLATELLLWYEEDAISGIEAQHPQSQIGDNSIIPVIILGRKAA